MDVLEKLGERIRKLRSDKNMSQEELAFLCGTNPAHIGRIERAINNTSLEVVNRIASALGITVSELLDFEHEPVLPIEDENILRVIAMMKAMPEEERAVVCRVVQALRKE